MLAPGKELPRPFIVHGRDRATVLDLKDFLQNRLGFREPVVLAEMPSDGKTVIEKFEQYASQADIIFVLITPDDLGYLSNEPRKAQPRPRLNVVFELGYFLGLLQRHSGRIFLLKKGAVEMPSDVAGMVSIDISAGIEQAGEEIRRQLKKWI
jgi:predicted nucleotide-binding protein